MTETNRKQLIHIEKRSTGGRNAQRTSVVEKRTGMLSGKWSSSEWTANALFRTLALHGNARYSITVSRNSDLLRRTG